MSPTPVLIDKEFHSIRNLLIDRFNYDPAMSGEFMTSYLCSILNIKETKFSDLVDCIYNDLKIEIKFARSFKNGTIGTRLGFKSLHGRSKEGKGADIHILIGYHDNNHLYFVIPSHKLESRKNLDVYLEYYRPRKNVKNNIWFKYLCRIQDIESKILSYTSCSQ